MVQKTSEIKEIFNKENVLICWNPNDYSKFLVKEGFKVATSYSELFEIPFQLDEESMHLYLSLSEFIEILKLESEFPFVSSDANELFSEFFLLIKKNFKELPTFDNSILDYNGYAKSLIDKNSHFKISQGVSTRLKELSKEIDKVNKKNDGREKESGIKQVPVNALVVLCELSWGKSKQGDLCQYKFSEMGGIQLVKYLRKNDIEFKIPVIFVSFLSLAQQDNLSSINEIIRLPALGHYYLQLPSNPEDWLLKLNTSKKKYLTETELEDVRSHFCEEEGMLKELNHDLLKKKGEEQFANFKMGQITPDFEVIFRKISEIVSSDISTLISDLRLLSHDSVSKCNYKIDQISKTIYNLIDKLDHPNLSIKKEQSSHRVLFLDDETESDSRLKALITLLIDQNIDVKVFSDPDEAYLELKKDSTNLYDIVISDYRIWNQNVKPKILDQQQGYSFIQRCAGLSQSYTFVVLSALDRNFLFKQIGNGIRFETLYKNGVLANKHSMLNFVRNLHDWGKSNQLTIASNISSNKVFIKCYNWFRNNRSRELIDLEISQLANDCLSKYIDLTRKTHSADSQKNFPTSCLYDDSQHCEKCGLRFYLGPDTKHLDALPTLDNISSYYKKPEDWNPENPDHIKNLKIKFAARRIFLFYFYSLGKINCKYKEHIVNHLIRYGWFRDKEQKTTNKKECVFDPPKDIWITVKHPKHTLEEYQFLKACGVLVTT